MGKEKVRKTCNFTWVFLKSHFSNLIEPLLRSKRATFAPLKEALLERKRGSFRV